MLIEFFAIFSFIKCSSRLVIPDSKNDGVWVHDVFEDEGLDLILYVLWLVTHSNLK